MDDNKKILSDIINGINKLDPKDTKSADAIRLCIDFKFGITSKEEEGYNEPMMLDKDSNVRYDTLRTGVRRNDAPKSIIMDRNDYVSYFEIINAIKYTREGGIKYKLKYSMSSSENVLIPYGRYTAQELLNILRERLRDPDLSIDDLDNLKIVRYSSNTHAVMDIYNALSKIYEDNNNEPMVYYIENYQLPANISTIMDWCINISSIPEHTTLRVFSKMIGDLCRGGIVTTDEEEDTICDEDLKRDTDMPIREDDDLSYNLKLNLRNIEELLSCTNASLQALYKDLRRKR